jgi:hypothetical protein
VGGKAITPRLLLRVQYPAPPPKVPESDFGKPDDHEIRFAIIGGSTEDSSVAETNFVASRKWSV